MFPHFKVLNIHVRYSSTLTFYTRVCVRVPWFVTCIRALKSALMSLKHLACRVHLCSALVWGVNLMPCAELRATY